MANNTIQLKRTTVSGRAPTTTNLKIAELAINLTDRIMYSSDGSTVFELGSNNKNISVTGNATIHAIIANGSIGTPGQVLTTDGTKIYWSSASVPQTIKFVNQSFVGDGVTKTFQITGGYSVGSMNVFLNGVRCSPDDCDTTSGTQITFETAPAPTLKIDAAGMLLGTGVLILESEKFQTQPPATKYRKKRALKKNDR